MKNHCGGRPNSNWLLISMQKIQVNFSRNELENLTLWLGYGLSASVKGSFIEV